MRTMMRAAAALVAGTALVGMSALGANAADFAGTPTAVDTDPDLLELSPSHTSLPGGGQDLWDGNALVFPADPDASAGASNQVYRTVAATLEAPRPMCEDGTFADDGTVTVTVSVHVTNDGPRGGAGYVGRLGVYHDDALVAADPITTDAPAGHQQMLTVTTQVPAADLAAGDVAVLLATETYHSQDGQTANNGTQWTAEQFSAAYEFGVGEDCADDIPIVAPAVAAGLGLAALAGVGVHRMRSRNQAD
ncbi:hypothetical protein [Phytoactinopolyspora limicola]|uniref:hypothetical protein n=1 Tax=Phytoactinopolyspora limicola TaxID=2715536 RepID=UPI00140DFD8B|nr:hypothetical protein [Phytoactinopolyspora limicola]